MFRPSSISVLALTAALAASPSYAQLLDADIGSGGIDISVGGDNGLGVGIGGSDGGLGVGVGVGGDDGINADVGVGRDSAVDVGVDVGGDGGLGVDATVGGGSAVDVGVDAGGNEAVSANMLGGNNTPGGNVLDADVNLVPGAPVRADVNLGSRPGATTGSGAGSALVDADVQVGGGQRAAVDRTQTVGGGTRLLALGSQAAQTEALLELIADPGLAEIDLEVSIDDRRIALVRVDEVLSEASLVQIEVAIGDNPDGRADLLAILEESAVLRSVLGREGVALEDVLAIEIGADGLTEVLVRAAPQALVAEVDALGIDVVDAELGAGSTGLDADIAVLPGAAGEEGSAAGQADLADLDIAVLSEQELAELDLSLLPREEQRVAAVLRILGNEGEASQTEGGQITIIDLDALLGEAAQAGVLATLGSGGDDATLAEVEANLGLTQALADAGIAPEALVAVRVGEGGQVRLVVDTGVQLADTPDGGDAGNGGQPPIGQPNPNPDGGAGTGGSANDGSGGGNDGAAPGAGAEEGGGGSAGGGNTGGGDNDGSDNRDDGATGAGPGIGAGAGAGTDQVLTAEVQAFALASQTVACDAGSAVLGAGEPAAAADILSAGPGDASLVLLEGCGTASLPIPAAEELRNAVAGNEALGAAPAQAGLAPADVVTVMQGDAGLTIFVVDPS